MFILSSYKKSYVDNSQKHSRPPRPPLPAAVSELARTASVRSGCGDSGACLGWWQSPDEAVRTKDCILGVQFRVLLWYLSVVRGVCHFVNQCEWERDHVQPIHETDVQVQRCVPEARRRYLPKETLLLYPKALLSRAVHSHLEKRCSGSPYLHHYDMCFLYLKYFSSFHKNLNLWVHGTRHIF